MPFPLFLDETEVRRAEKIIFGDRSNLSKVWMTAPTPLISRSGYGFVSGILATLVVPSKGRPPLNTLGTGHYSSPEGGDEGGYFTEVIPPYNLWWLSLSPLPRLHFPSKFEWSPLWILPTFSAIPHFGFSVTTDRLFFFSQKSSDPP